MNILIQLCEPKGDLSAFIDQRKSAWQASGSAIVSEEDLTLKNGQPAKEFVLESQGQTSYTLISVLGDNYLVASGDGDIDRIRQVARSLRCAGMGPESGRFQGAITGSMMLQESPLQGDGCLTAVLPITRPGQI